MRAKSYLGAFLELGDAPRGSDFMLKDREALIKGGIGRAVLKNILRPVGKSPK